MPVDLTAKKRTPFPGINATRKIFSALGPTETVFATLPTLLVQKVRKRVGPRQFCQFVAESLRRELIRLNREEFVAEVVNESGPLDPSQIAAWRNKLRQSQLAQMSSRPWIILRWRS